MGNESRKLRFVGRIQNRQFRKLFFKNWLCVFLCIVLPLVFCGMVIRYYSEKSLFEEIDVSAQRSLYNTNATVETLLKEACNILEKEILDDSVEAFFKAKRSIPVNYAFISTVNSAMARIDADIRDNLYYSVDAYSARSQFMISSLHRGQSYEYLSDKSLITVYNNYLDENPRDTLFAVLRTASYVGGPEKRVISIYRSYGTQNSSDDRCAFASISIDVDKMIGYISDGSKHNLGSYLIVDQTGKVLLDTSERMYEESLSLEGKQNGSLTATKEINGKKMLISWVEMQQFDWKCVQMIPMDEYEATSIRVRKFVLTVIVIGAFFSSVLSYVATVKLFKPVIAILRLLENPNVQGGIEDETGEIQYLLIRILEVFQKNATLEAEMLDRISALRRARAKALQEQMTPHFLNNVLQVINMIAVAEIGDDNSLTSQSIILLADILDNSKKQKYSLTTVKEEILYTKKFVELIRLRYGNGITCVYEVEAEAENMLIPGISLQTLVENSVAHGFGPKGGIGSVYIKIGVNEQQGLNIVVEDDGVGMDPEALKKLEAMLNKDYIVVGEHLGLVNLFQRFELIYGEACSFNIKKSIYGGTCVEIVIPKVSEDWVCFME